VNGVSADEALDYGLVDSVVGRPTNAAARRALPAI